jgi:hypothetical protein
LVQLPSDGSILNVGEVMNRKNCFHLFQEAVGGLDCRGQVSLDVEILHIVGFPFGLTDPLNVSLSISVSEPLLISER